MSAFWEGQYNLTPPINYTDPNIIILDGGVPHSPVKKYYVPSDSKTLEDGELPIRTEVNMGESDKIKSDGSEIPIIKINSFVIPESDIISVKFHYTDVKPSCEVQIKKQDYLKLENIGMANKLTVIILPPVDNGSKKIAVDFYITNIQEFSTSVRYSGEYFFPILVNERTTRTIKLEGTKSPLTTFELFKEIALETGMGYVVTKFVEEIIDPKIRLSMNQTRLEVLNQHIKFGGLDDQSFFKFWVDVYGYLVVCNMSWIFAEAVNIDKLAINQLSGFNNLDTNNLPDKTVDFAGSTFRTFTNWKTNNPTGEHNRILSYEWIVDNYKLKTHGTENTFYAINHVINGGNNGIASLNTSVQENSLDGEAGKSIYTFPINKYIGVELGLNVDGNTPVLFQEKQRDAFFTRLNAKKLKVTLEYMNVHLEKGVLINLNIFEYERDTKIKMYRNSANLKDGGDLGTDAAVNEEIISEIANNDEIGVPNLSLSGIYFVDGIEYIYDVNNSQKFKQILYLIKHSKHVSYLNTASAPKY